MATHIHRLLSSHFPNKSNHLNPDQLGVIITDGVITGFVEPPAGP